MINGNASEGYKPGDTIAEQRISYRSGAAVYRWNAAFNREYPAVLLTPLWLTKPIFTPLYRLKWPFLGTKPSDQVAEKKCQHRLDWFHLHNVSPLFDQPSFVVFAWTIPLWSPRLII